MSREKLMMAAHGTELMRLKPGAIVGAARADLERRARNEARICGEGAREGFERYAFAAAHVRRAKSVEHLLQLALKNPYAPAGTVKAETIAIYSDQSVLKAALLQA